MKSLLPTLLVVSAAMPMTSHADITAVTLRGDGQVIADGDTTPSTLDGTDFGDVLLAQGREFVITVDAVDDAGTTIWASRDSDAGGTWAQRRNDVAVNGFARIIPDQTAAGGAWQLWLRPGPKPFVSIFAEDISIGTSWRPGDDMDLVVGFDPAGIVPGTYTATVEVYPLGGVGMGSAEYAASPGVIVLDYAIEATVPTPSADFTLALADDEVIPLTSATGDFGDPDNDGIINLIEWAIGTPTDEMTTAWGTMVEVAPGLWGVEYTRDPARDDLRVTPQFSTSWPNARWRSAGAQRTQVGTQGTLEVWQASAPEIEGTVYWQLNVERVAP